MNNNETDQSERKIGKDALERLRRRFLGLWRRSMKTGVPDYGESAWEELRNRYQEPHRRYHDLRHVRFCLEQFDLVRSLTDDPDAVEMSIWYHDVIYEPGAADNEKRSAGFFAWYTVDLFPGEFIVTVRHLILATAHPETLCEGDAGFVTDIDLSSFALPWSDFDRDNKDLREEQSDVSDEFYYPAKVRFLTLLSNRSRIFRTDFFHERFEAQARQNIERYLAEAMMPPGR